MLNSKSGNKLKPASSKGVPVLTILFSLLFASLGALGGWLYWSDLQKNKASLSAAITTIAPPEPIQKEQGEKLPSEETVLPTVAEEANDQQPKETQAEPVMKSADTISVDEPGEDVEKDPVPDPKVEVVEETAAPTVEAPLQTPQEVLPATNPEVPKEKPLTAEVTEETSPIQEPEQAIEPAENKDETEVTNEVIEPEAEVPEEKKLPPQVASLPPIEKAIPLPAVPDPELATNSDYGLLPVIGPTGRQPWRIYSRPFEDPLDRPRIAILISEMGMSVSATKSAIQNLQGAVSLSFNPYARDLQSWIEQARAAGHEVLLQLPMEPFGYPKNDPGPHSLLTSLTDRENLNRLDWMLGRFTGYSGVTNQMGSKFTATAEYITPVLDVIKSRGLLFLDGRTSAKSVAGQIASNNDVPVAINNRFLDHKADRVTIDARLKDLERIARYTGTAVGIGYPYPVTLERIALWSQTLARKGFVLAPVSAVINRQEIQ